MRQGFLPILVLLAQAGMAQSPEPRFEVASIRPSAPTAQQVNIGLHIDGTQARIVSLSLRDYVTMGYDTKTYLVEGPNWLGEKHFDISATLPAGGTLSQIGPMMQALLKERFGMKVHKSEKEVSVYVLTLGKRPLAMTKAAPPTAQEEAVTIAASGSGQGVSVNLGRGASYTFANNKFEGKRLDMPTIADSLSIYMNQPVVDQTGLEGAFDVTLEITAEDYRAMLLRAAMVNGVVLPPQMQQMVDTATLPSLYDAFEKVGLKLESKKIPHEVIVIDEMAQAPTEN